MMQTKRHVSPFAHDQEVRHESPPADSGAASQATVFEKTSFHPIDKNMPAEKSKEAKAQKGDLQNSQRPDERRRKTFRLASHCVKIRGNGYEKFVSNTCNFPIGAAVCDARHCKSLLEIKPGETLDISIAGIEGRYNFAACEFPAVPRRNAQGANWEGGGPYYCPDPGL